MKRIGLIAVLVAAFALVAGCSGTQPVKQYEMGKVAAETILFDARVMQNRGTITADQFEQIRKVYDQLKQAQDIAIDAREAMITYETSGSKLRAQVAMEGVLRLSAQMITLAQSMGLMKGGQ
jgi:uncharacterized protein YcfL